MIINANIPIDYSTTCIVNYKDYSLDSILRKYNIILPNNKAGMNKIDKYDYITSKESSLLMDKSNILYKELKELSNNKEIIYLNKPISFKVEFDEDGIYYVNQKYNLYVYGQNQMEAEANLVDAFNEQMTFFCYDDDSKLDANARLLKQNLLGIFKYAKEKK